MIATVTRISIGTSAHVVGIYIAGPGGRPGGGGFVRVFIAGGLFFDGLFFPGVLFIPDRATVNKSGFGRRVPLELHSRCAELLGAARCGRHVPKSVS